MYCQAEWIGSGRYWHPLACDGIQGAGSWKGRVNTFLYISSHIGVKPEGVYRTWVWSTEIGDYICLLNEYDQQWFFDLGSLHWHSTGRRDCAFRVIWLFVFCEEAPEVSRLSWNLVNDFYSWKVFYLDESSNFLEVVLAQVCSRILKFSKVQKVFF